MSSRHRLRARFALGGLLVAISITLAGSVSANPRDRAQHLDPAAGNDADLVEVELQPVAGQAVVEVSIADAVSPDLAIDQAAERLLDATASGALVAVADRVGGTSGTLVIAAVGGTTLQIELPGVLDAAFAPDAGWLAVIDGGGGLWRVDVASAEATRLSDGPFSSPIFFDRDGMLLLRAVSSVEAPFIAVLVRLDPSDGSVEALSDHDELVYTARQLSDGAIAYAAHRAGGGTLVMRLPAGAAGRGGEPVLDLGDRAINVTIGPDGTAAAFEVADDGIYLTRVGEPTRRIGIGSRPAFAPDGSSLLVRVGESAAVMGLDGSLLAVLDEAAATWVTCTEGCQP